MTSNEWVVENLSDIKKWATGITRKHRLTKELISYAIEAFLLREDTNEITNSGGARFFIVRIMLNSWRSGGSEFWRLYRREDQNQEINAEITEWEPSPEYDPEPDIQFDRATQVLTELKGSKNPYLVYIALIFEQYVQIPNYSKLANITGIPRTSIAHAVKECRQIIIDNLDEDPIKE
jgi:hypothetical protein